MHGITQGRLSSIRSYAANVRLGYQQLSFPDTIGLDWSLVLGGVCAKEIGQNEHQMNKLQSGDSRS
jgi:hypothetical protein